jgi:hypothetical protein
MTSTPALASLPTDIEAATGANPALDAAIEGAE